jgi:hypothetical protein
MNHSYSSPQAATPTGDLETVFDYIRSLVAKRYFGVIQLSFQSGTLTNIRSEQSFKAHDISNLVATSKGQSNGRAE